MGARAAAVTRVNNPWLEKQIQREGMELGFLDGRAEGLSRLEQVYNEQINKGLNQYITEFFNAFRELANNPESLASRTLVREAAISMTNDFKRVTDQLESIQLDLDGQIRTLVEEVNQISKEIAQLNEKILQVENQGNVANDERDRRDLLVKKLAEKIDITYAESKDGQLNVTAGNSAVLVSGNSYNSLEAKLTGDRNRVEIFFRATESGTPFNLTQQFKGGRIGGILDVRDKVIEEFRRRVNETAFTLAKEVNTIHSVGYDRHGNTGNLFFSELNGAEGAAEKIKITNEIYHDVGRISVAARPDAPGDNTIANMISAIQHRKIMSNGEATIDDFYSTQVGQIGTFTQRAVKAQESQRNIISQLNNLRESISGVSLDEEATKMIEFQKAYDASARLIRVADEMLDTVLSLKRL
ncbi:MAG: flagellar hook-associated protein FlgK [Bdellovibrionaceae bacterium]|nr:flagellar hook-associated protein FlgK [Pseudobdellovibrionaceae bacterium]